MGGEVVVTCMGMDAGNSQQGLQREMEREEVRKTIRKMKAGKTPSVDAKTAEMLKCGGETVVVWMLYIFE